MSALVRNIIQITFRIRDIEMSRWRDGLFIQGKQGDHELQSAGSAQ